jgi:hypothetical protein
LKTFSESPNQTTAYRLLGQSAPYLNSIFEISPSKPQGNLFLIPQDCALAYETSYLAAFFIKGSLPGRVQIMTHILSCCNAKEQNPGELQNPIFLAGWINSIGVLCDVLKRKG